MEKLVLERLDIMFRVLSAMNSIEGAASDIEAHAHALDDHNIISLSEFIKMNNYDAREQVVDLLVAGLSDKFSVDDLVREFQKMESFYSLKSDELRAQFCHFIVLALRRFR